MCSRNFLAIIQCLCGTRKSYITFSLTLIPSVSIHCVVKSTCCSEKNFISSTSFLGPFTSQPLLNLSVLDNVQIQNEVGKNIKKYTKYLLYKEVKIKGGIDCHKAYKISQFVTYIPS